MTCIHRYAHTDNHIHTQGHPGRFKDRSCWTHPHGDKGRGGCRCMVELRGVGHTHGRPRVERQPVHIPTHRVTGRCCHTQGQGVVVTIACMHACIRAYIAIAHCHAVTKDPVTHEHTCTHMCPVMQSPLLAMTVTVTQSNKKHNYTSTHVYTA